MDSERCSRTFRLGPEMSLYKTRSPRFQTERLPITIRSHGTFVWAHGIVLNLSQSGVQVHTAAQLSQGSDVEIEFNTVNKQGRKTRRRMRAKIVWMSGQRYGCHFKK
jgi:hypothetical protein